MNSSPTSGLRLFGLSFTALFMELMVIRWVPAEVRLVAYYANLMLISSFLGLGVGAMVAGRGWGLWRWFGWVLAADVGVLMLAGLATLPGSSGEMRFFGGDAARVVGWAA